MRAAGKERFWVISVSIFLNIHRCFVLGNLEHLSPCFKVYPELPVTLTYLAIEPKNKFFQLACILVPTTQRPSPSPPPPPPWPFMLFLPDVPLQLPCTDENSSVWPSALFHLAQCPLVLPYPACCKCQDFNKSKPQ